MTEIKRYFLELSYDGTKYHGWQAQPNAVTVQEMLDKALSTILRQSIETVGCGRTDAGVHASQFFAHFDGPADLEHKSSFLTGLNALLPFDIAISKVHAVENDAHARFDATKRSYQYHVHFNKNPFKHGYSWLLRDIPDVSAMNAAAAIIMEYTDFSCFSKSNTQVFTNNCKITNAQWSTTNEGLVFHISADRFLRNMVRAIVGTLLLAGNNTLNESQLRDIIESKNRSKAGTSVPACGLYLTEIIYPYL